MRKEVTHVNKIGDIIKEHRKSKDLTQQELGEKVFVSKQAVSKWENGRTLPDIETLQKLAQILDINADEILGGTVQEVNKTRKLLKAVLIVSVVAVILFSGAIIGYYYLEKSLIEFGYQDRANSANQYARDVTMVQLIANPEQYDGKLVRVIGVGRLEFEGNCICISKEDYKYRTFNSIWIELGSRAISYDEAKSYNGKYVIVEGFFDKDDRGHADMFCGSIKEISRYQLWETAEDDNG